MDSSLKRQIREMFGHMSDDEVEEMAIASEAMVKGLEALEDLLERYSDVFTALARED